VTNTIDDKHIITTFLTHNPEIQYGADGIEFDKAGNLYVGNLGAGAVHREPGRPYASKTNSRRGKEYGGWFLVILTAQRK
jgi:hypothetical protein